MTWKPWTPKRIQHLLHCNVQGHTDTKPEPGDDPIVQMTTDSRKVKPGSCFIAIHGDQFDGHQFIEQAFGAGATVAISEKPYHGTIPQGAWLLQCQSTLDAIRKIAAEHREQTQIPVIAIVGAVGKTTTKELASSILKGKFDSVLKTEGSLNGYLGIPLTLLELTSAHQVAVIEIGIDEIGAMEKHLQVVRPTHVLLTANGPEHLHQLKTVEIAASEELKAFDYAVSHEVQLTINLNDPYVCAWLKKNQSRLNPNLYKTYSLKGQELAPELRHHHWNADLTGSQSIKIDSTSSGIEFEAQVPLPGQHHAHNLLSALTLASHFALTPEQMLKGLSTFKTAFGRTEIHTLPDGAELIGDYYNSNPTSLAAALQLLMDRSRAKNPPLITHAVLGDMLELGPDEELFHRQFGSVLNQLGIDRVWLYGDRMKWLQDSLNRTPLAPKCQHFRTHDELLNTLKDQMNLDPGHRQIVLIKGSRGMRMEKIAEALRNK